ncbi:hypothetical protein [Clostridium sp. Marseille-P2415]|uniref:hypothetical protein n=1 Tax=Clostridium sp. Marseille-P2415 TaxID=1805471 RepID=UPI00098868D4|nr:hypothetical protein [Clostridium sp. Marseille-P2415]
MNLDEKIALLERARRQKEKEEREQSEREKEKAPEKKLTLEEALDGIMAGKMRLENGELFEFETREYSGGHIPLVVFKSFYQASKEDQEGIIYVNHTHEVSQIISWPRERIKPMSLNQWANMLVNGMAANRMHARIVKKKQLDHVEYICFDVPTGKGWLYNIVFRMRGKEEQLTGNYNCMKEEQDTYGIFLEAMVVALNNCLTDREGGGLSGEHGKEGRSE